MIFEGNYWSADVDKEGRVGAWELDGDCRPEREYIPKKPVTYERYDHKGEA